MRQCPGQFQTLYFAARKVLSVFQDLGIVAQAIRHDAVVDLGISCR